MARDGDDVERDQYLSDIYQIIDPIERTRAVTTRSVQLLRASSPDTFLGRRRLEPIPTEHEKGSADGAMPERSGDEPGPRSYDDSQIVQQ